MTNETNTELWILRETAKGSRDNKTITQSWHKVHNEINLGSINKPLNNNIVKFEYKEVESEPPLNKFKMFGF